MHLHPPGTRNRTQTVRRLRAISTCGIAIGLAAGSLHTPALAESAPTPLTTNVGLGAQAGSNWIASRLTSTGSAPLAGDTREAASALFTSATNEAAARKALSFLRSNLDPAATHGALAQLILVAVVAGENPRAFGGTGAINDLVARLATTKTTSGPDRGLYGPPNEFGSVYNQGLVLQALGALGETDADAIAWLKAQQCADGSFEEYRANLTTPCDPLDPAGFTGPDTNGTASAVLGLAAVGTTAPLSPLAWLDSHQSATGGWAYLPGATEADDPNSTALVIQALRALGVTDADARFTKGTSTPVSTLLRFQFGCAAAAADRGGFWYPPYGDSGYLPDVKATSQAVIALAGAAVPAKKTSTWTEPTDACAPPASSSTTLSTTTTSSTVPAAKPTTTSAATTTSLQATTTPTSASSTAAPAAVAGASQTRPAVAAKPTTSTARYAG